RNSIQNVVFAVLPFVTHVVKDVLPAHGTYPVFLIGQSGDAGKRRVRDRRGGERGTGPESGGVYDIDRDIRSIGHVNHALRLPVESGGCDESLREEYDRLFTGYSTLRGADRRKRGQDRARLLDAKLATQKFELL